MAGVLYEVNNRVAHVTMNGPENRNAMNEAMQLGLIDAFRKAEAAEDVSVVLLSEHGELASCEIFDAADRRSRKPGGA